MIFLPLLFLSSMLPVGPLSYDMNTVSLFFSPVLAREFPFFFLPRVLFSLRGRGATAVVADGPLLVAFPSSLL